MKMLLHTCCAPCLSGSRIPLEEEGFEICGLWYNPNIQPFTEHQRRKKTLQRYLFLDPVDIHFTEGYEQMGFLKDISALISSSQPVCDAGFMEERIRKERCRKCYERRMNRTARKAKEMGSDCFSTTLLLSKHQDHEEIRKACKKAASVHEVEFVYRDLRKMWKDSVRRSRELDLYRQPYCGCIFSEHERFGGE